MAKILLNLINRKMIQYFKNKLAYLKKEYQIALMAIAMSKG